MSFQPAFNARLITEVKKHPCLYNHSRRGNGDPLERHRLWDHIAKNIDSNCTPEFAKKRWLQLRDRYRKELKLAIRNNFASPVRWVYFSQLSWLDPYLKDNISQVADETKKFQEISDDYNSFFLQFPNLTNLKEEVEDDEGDPALESSVLDRLLASTRRSESVSPEMVNDESGPQSVEASNENDEEQTENATSSAPVEINNDTTDTTPMTMVKARIMEVLKENNEAVEQKPSVETLIAANQARFAHHLAAQLSGMSQGMFTGSKKSESAATPQQLFNNTSTSETPRAQTPAIPLAQQCKEHFRAKQRQQQQAENLMKTHLQQVGRTALEWLNDEDLLYSRIVGLKLKKMDPKKRRKVRSQIMALLDEVEDMEKDDDSCSSARDNDEECGPVEQELDVSTIATS